MKLLLLSDEPSITSKLTPREEDFQLNSVLIDFYLIQNEKWYSEIETILSKTRYHLILIIIKGKFQGEFVQHSTLINVVNNYISESELQNSMQIDAPFKENHLPSIVNKTNSYFNVFLDITKAVSFTSKNGETDITLKRLDVIHTTNYYLAYLCQKFNCAYYILNYENELNMDEITSLLEKLD